MIITCGGVIGVGKSSMTKILGDLLQVNQVYEPVEDNPLLEKFYEDKGTYGFVFQIDMLSKRFEMIEEALMSRNAILDRSIYEDSIFLHQLHQEGHINDFELKAYDDLLARMLRELEYIPKKSPDLMIVLDIDFEEEIRRINARARDFEVVEEGTELYEYFKQHNQNYKEWMQQDLGFPKIIIDCNKLDFVNNLGDRRKVLSEIIAKLVEVEALTFEEAIEAIFRLHDGEKEVKDIALDLYNMCQKSMGGAFPYHNLARIYDNHLLSIEDLREWISNR